MVVYLRVPVSGAGKVTRGTGALTGNLGRDSGCFCSSSRAAA